MDSNLQKRILFAVVAIPLAIAIIWFGGWALTALVMVACGLGCRELFELTRARGVEPLRENGIGAATVIPLLVSLWLTGTNARTVVSANAGFIAIGVFMLFAVDALLTRGPNARPLSALSITLFGVLYTSGLPSVLLFIRAAQPTRSWAGTALVMFPLVITWVGDTAAMFGGRAFGRTKLAPTISPGKTRAGGVAGLVGGVAVGAAFALWVFPAVDIPFTLGPACVAALLISVLGQLGDLVESLFKREAGVKDSSSLIPGHGGVLDRLDSLYFAIPAAAACYRVFGIV